VGGDQFSRAVSDALKIPLQDAKILRVKLCSQQQAAPLEDGRTKIDSEAEAPAPAHGDIDSTGDNSFALLDSALRKSEKSEQPAKAQVANDAESGEGEMDESDQQARVHQACQEPLHRLVEELTLSRRYYESTFPDTPIDRLIFVGGEARQRGLCQQVAREMGLAAQIGDPLVRMGRISDISIDSGIDRRQPQPAWAVAIGLSMGPKGGKSADANADVAEQLVTSRG
jgi:Tfp pilus assembly PilM family ATPase